MGGTIFVGIREEDGKEHLLHAWTNPLPHTSGSPSFYDKGKDWQELMAACDGPYDGYYKRLKRLSWRNTYGYVLYDFKDKVILSSNGYFTPGQWGILDRDPEDMHQLKEMLDLGWVEQVYDMKDAADTEAYFKGLPAQNTLAALRTLFKGTDHVYVRVKFCPAGWTITSIGEDPKLQSAGLRTFLKGHGWKAK